MSDKEKAAEPAKKGGAMKWVLIGVGALAVVGGGVGGGMYLMNSGVMGGGQSGAAVQSSPQLVPKSEQVRVAGDGTQSAVGQSAPMGEGGDKYASTYYQLEKEFTANLRDSVHFIQVGIAISTPYDSRVIDNLKTHELAVRSAVLLALGETSEDEVFTAEGKSKLQKRLVAAINAVLKEKEGFGGIGNVYFTNFIVQ